MSIIIEEKAVVLFQGDSITDAGRSYEDNSQLGGGYAGMAAAWLSALHPDMEIEFLNRGISGNRVKDLKSRWQTDCIDLSPTWVSIMIGINDTWRRFDSNDPTSAEAYEDDYCWILNNLRENLDAGIIILEPFVLPVPDDRRGWRADLDPKIDAARRLARQFDAVYVPLDGIFAEAATRREASFWAADGVHPSPAGHALIAQSWLKAVRAI